ncbi:MAG: pilus assembly protein [Micrococcaceae bacterium]
MTKENLQHWCYSHDKRGSVSAEFATAFPAVMLILCLCFEVSNLLHKYLLLHSAAAQSVRLVARTETKDKAAATMANLAPNSNWEVKETADQVVLTASMPYNLKILSFTVTLRSDAIALKESSFVEQ